MAEPLDLKAVRRRCHLARASGTVSLDIPYVLALCDELERLRELVEGYSYVPPKDRCYTPDPSGWPNDWDGWTPEDAYAQGLEDFASRVMDAMGIAEDRT